MLRCNAKTQLAQSLCLVELQHSLHGFVAGQVERLVLGVVLPRTTTAIRSRCLCLGADWAFFGWSSRAEESWPKSKAERSRRCTKALQCVLPDSTLMP